MTLPVSMMRRSMNCLHCEHRSLGMFCNLSPEALLEFDSLGVHAELKPGALIFEQEAPIRGVFVLCSGRAKLSATSRQGKTLLLKIAVPGDVLGLAAAISGTRHEVTAVTIEPTEIKKIEQAEFMRFLEKFGEASLHAAHDLSDEYRDAFFDVRRLALSVSAAARLAGVLMDWGRKTSSEKSEMRFSMALTHEELANLIGSSRETVTRILSRFKMDKLIRVKGATIWILAPERLEKLAV